MSSLSSQYAGVCAEDVSSSESLEALSQLRVAWDVPVMSTQQFDSLSPGLAGLSPEQCRYLLAFGLLAPTSHNTVPQRFEVMPNGGGITVWLDREYVLPASDPTGRQATISCGCAIAHLRLAAQAYGWQSFARVMAVDERDCRPRPFCKNRFTQLAQIAFSRGADRLCCDELLFAMLDRKIVRAEFDPRVQLEERDNCALQAVVQRHPRLRLHLIADATSQMILGKFQELADSTVFNREDFARELGQWLLANDDLSPLGMRGGEFGLNDDAAARFHRGLCGVERLLPDEVAGMAKGANSAMRSASAVAVISTDDDSVSGRLSAGQAYAEMALLLQRRGFVTAMHAAITEVEPANMALRGRLRTTNRPIVVFRVGKPVRAADGCRLHSTRPPLEWVLLSDEEETVALAAS